MPDDAGVRCIETVRGPVAADSVARTLIHEHLHIDLRPVLAEHGYSANEHSPFDCVVAGEARWNPGVHEANYDLTDIDLVADELAMVVPHGINCVVDATPTDLGRNPEALRELSERLDLHIVMGAGWYLEASHRHHIAGRSVDGLTQVIVDECRDGVGQSGIRPGIIGEIGTNSPASDSEMTVVRAAAQAAIDTGRAVSIHLHPWGSEGGGVLDAAVECGLGADRILLNHLTTAALDSEYLRSLLDRGVNLAFDLFGFDHSLLGEGRYAPSDWDVAHVMADLIAAGHVSQLFMSQDVGVRTRLHRYGGWGYDHLAKHIVPLLARAGVEESDIEVLLVGNPRRLLSIVEPAPSK
jgi:phosphotriesterase-related protein